MPLEITVSDKLCQNVLLKYGNGAGVKSELALKFGQQPHREHHVAHTDRGSDGLGKGV